MIDKIPPADLPMLQKVTQMGSLAFLRGVEATYAVVESEKGELLVIVPAPDDPPALYPMRVRAAAIINKAPRVASVGVLWEYSGDPADPRLPHIMGALKNGAHPSSIDGLDEYFAARVESRLGLSEYWHKIARPHQNWAVFEGQPRIDFTEHGCYETEGMMRNLLPPQMMYEQDRLAEHSEMFISRGGGTVPFEEFEKDIFQRSAVSLV